MMKKIIILFALFLLCVMPSSCSMPYEKPYGVWQSEDNRIWMDINPEKDHPYLGRYQKNDGTIIVVDIRFGMDKKISIQNTRLPSEEYGTFYFVRPFKVKDGKLYYGKKGDEDLIIFNKIKEYEVPKK